jgi:hypothetical protein
MSSVDILVVVKQDNAETADEAILDARSTLEDSIIDPRDGFDFYYDGVDDELKASRYSESGREWVEAALRDMRAMFDESLQGLKDTLAAYGAEAVFEQPDKAPAVRPLFRLKWALAWPARRYRAWRRIRFDSLPVVSLGRYRAFCMGRYTGKDVLIYGSDGVAVRCRRDWQYQLEGDADPWLVQVRVHY